ncbi:MAG TPA: hypothetical protein VGL25_10805 [Casimicrobiaceae bacterium]|jgi:hypothetical protein
MTDSDGNEEASRTDEKAPVGPYVIKGMPVGVSHFSISMDENGNVTADLRLNVGLDVTHHWLGIAIQHVETCNGAKGIVDRAWRNGDANAFALLEQEFTDAMQAVAAAAFALDAFYACVKEHAPVPDEVREAWRKNRTSRAAQLAEAFRLAFRMDEMSFRIIRDRIGQIFKCRDIAVHPPGTLSEPVLHPRMNVAIEQRFVIFSTENAQNSAASALSIVAQLIRIPKPDNAALGEYCRVARERIDPILVEWEATHGALFERASDQ